MAGDERRDNFATREDMEQINEKLDSLEAMCFDIQSAPRQKPVKDLLPWLPFVLSIISLIVFIVTMNMTIQQLRVDQNSISTRLDSFIEKQEAFGDGAARRELRARICTLDDPKAVKSALRALYAEAAEAAA